MATHPDVKPRDWIQVGSHQCVVRLVFPAGGHKGVCQVVYNKDKPTTRDVDWNGEAWFFPERDDFGGYGRLDDPCVQQLKRGR